MAKHDSLAASVTSFTGEFGSQSSGIFVGVTTKGAVDTGNGWSNITPIKDGSLTDLIFTPTNSTLFGSFSFRGQLEDAGSVVVKVFDQLGDTAQTFTFSGLPKSADFDRIGILGTLGETIKSVEITSDVTKRRLQRV